MRKYVVNFFLFVLCFFSFYGDVLAEEELVVNVDSNSFEVSNDNVTVGDEVTLKVAITSNLTEPLETVKFYFTKPVTKVQSKVYELFYNSSSGLYEGKIVIDNTWQNGNYIIDYMYFYSGGCSDILYNSGNYYSLGWGKTDYDWSVNLGSYLFTVSGTTADTEFPTINGSSLLVSKRKSIVGDVIKYEIEINDNVAISSALLKLYWKSGSDLDIKSIDLNYNSITGLYEGYFTITEETAIGTWYVYAVVATDTNDNYKRLDNSVISVGKNEYAWSNSVYTIYNYGTNPDSKLTIGSLNIDDNSITAGETANISLIAMNYFGISDVKLYYKKGDEEELYLVEALFSKINSTSGSNGLTWNYNEYVGSVTFNEYGYNGNWTLDKIVITSERNNVTTIYNSELYEEFETDLSALNFETVGLIDDQTSPDIIDYMIDKDYAYYNDSIELLVNASDDLSGIHNVLANYTLPDGTSKDYILELSDGSYKYEFNYDNQNLNGKYKINFILAKDKAGNITKITENISNLSFYFCNTITIITPTLYPDTTTSYTLKALFADNLEIDNVLWSSSNTSIATINANTGVMSTKYKEGKVTITAIANDGSGLYGSVELIVTGAKVGVGRTTSLGNSNYIGYSSVVWEIEDESILRKTGKTGYVSVNDNYKHSIEVKGLKTGITKLSMFTPSGDLIVSSDVYVYDEINSISALVDRIDLEKNESVDLEALGLYASGKKNSDELYYYSDNNSVVTVDYDGRVNAKAGGVANIIVYSTNSKARLTIPVTVNVYSESISVDDDSITLNEENNTYQIKYTVLPEDTLNKNVTFKSSDENVVKVSDDGLITAVRNGTAKVTIYSVDQHSSKEINVTVENLLINVAGLNFSQVEDIPYTGNELKPEFLIKDSDYYLVKDIDYTVEYSNNINVGTATSIVTGIGKYKGTKIVEFKIVKADPNIKYSSSDKTVNYDEKYHTIDLTIESPENVIVKYANEQGEYVLDEIPKYLNPGYYNISYQLSINDNYSVITGTNCLIINPGVINVNISDLEYAYDGKEHFAKFDVDIEDYDIQFRYESYDYDMYFYNNYSENVDGVVTNSVPGFTEPGYYRVEYQISKDGYMTLHGSYYTKVSGMTGYNKKLLKFDNEKLIVRNFVFDLNDIYSSMNFIILNTGTFRRYQSGKEYYDIMARTSDSMDIIIDDKVYRSFKLVILGDVNGDGKISALDYVRIKNHIMGDKIISDDLNKTAADVTEDSNISALDYVRIKNHIMNSSN